MLIMEDKMKKVITYGTYDLFHEGHYKLLKKSKGVGRLSYSRSNNRTF